jgi:WD40 repeat protein
MKSDQRKAGERERRLLFVLSVAVLSLVFCEIPSAASATPNTWAYTGSMTSSHDNHTSTLLLNGKVLITGGNNGIYNLASAELYDFSTGTFSPTGSMKYARTNHTATLLANGKVLIVGGYSAVAELFDPATGKFTTTGSMYSPRENCSATLLSDGKVLIAGGTSYYNGQYTVEKSAQIYDPSTGQFGNVPGGNMGTARDSHTATLLPDGKVLLAGGLTPYPPYPDVLQSTDSAELYDPATGKFSPTASLQGGRAHHTATLLTNGKVLIAGGYWGIPFYVYNEAEIYDPTTGVFAKTGSMGSVRWSHAATLLPTGKVLVAGGFGYDEADDFNSAELYDPSTGKFAATGPMNSKRGCHTATVLPDGKVLAAGGRNWSSGVTNKSELYSTDLSGVQPQIVVDVNGSRGNVWVAQGQNAIVSISAQAGNRTGQNADFWAVLLWYDPNKGAWLPLPPLLLKQGPFYSMLRTPVANFNWLPEGTYTLAVGVDMQMNKILDPSPSYYDLVGLMIFKPFLVK